MRAVCILVGIFVLFGDFALIGVNMGVVAEDLRPAELTEHELLLKNISQSGLTTAITALQLELMAKSIGNDFYGISAAEEAANRENNAIVRAMFECDSNLLTMDRKMKPDSHDPDLGPNLARLLNETGSLSKMFSYFCSTIDEHFHDDPCYATAKNKYQSQKLTSPKKTYMYGMPKSDDDLRKAIAELLNDPQLRKFRVVQMFYGTVYTRNDVLKLAKQPGKREIVQKVFEKSIESLTSHLKDYKPEEIDPNDLRGIFVQGYLNRIICETLRSNINENPDLKTDFGPIGKCSQRYPEGWNL